MPSTFYFTQLLKRMICCSGKTNVLYLYLFNRQSVLFYWLSYPGMCDTQVDLPVTLDSPVLDSPLLDSQEFDVPSLQQCSPSDPRAIARFEDLFHMRSAVYAETESPTVSTCTILTTSIRLVYCQWRVWGKGLVSHPSDILTVALGKKLLPCTSWQHAHWQGLHSSAHMQVAHS